MDGLPSLPEAGSQNPAVGLQMIQLPPILLQPQPVRQPPEGPLALRHQGLVIQLHDGLAEQAVPVVHQTAVLEILTP